MNENMVSFFTFAPLMTIGSNTLLWIIALLTVIIVALSLVLWSQYKKTRHSQKEMDRGQMLNDQLLDIYFLDTLVMDKFGNIQQMNQACLKELNLNGDMIKGKSAFDVIDILVDKQSILPDLIRDLDSGKQQIDLPQNCVICNLQSNMIFMVQGTLIGTYKENRLNNVVFLFRNIESELTQEYILNMALSRTKIFPWFYDMKLDHMIIDSRWFSHLGIDEGNGTLSSEEFGALVHPDDRDEILNALAKQLQGELNKDTFTYRLKRADGTWEWFEVQSVYLGRVADIPYRIVGVCQSIHEHKVTEQKLIDARNKAEESDKLKSAFLANMSHEIRTPLNAIVGFSTLLSSVYSELTIEEINEYTAMIEKNSQLLMFLISDVLDLSKIESNTMEFHLQPFSLNTLMLEISQTQRLSMDEEVKLVMDIPDDDTMLTADSMRLGQVMNNLINNAIKFTSKGSVCFGYKLTDDDRVQLFVEDTGVGMPEEMIEHIFERFFKGDSFVQGTGLGLAICKIIVEHFEGKIEVVSKVGEGSRFMVSLPLKNS